MPSEFLHIGDVYYKYHSTYYGWKLYRAWDLFGNHGKMNYLAISSKMDALRAKNLSGIKDAVREVESV